MVDDRKTDEPFLQRWARRKADAAKPVAEEAPPAASGAPGAEVGTTETASLPQSPETPPANTEDGTAEIDLSTLPDIDSMDAESDFSVFMKNGIPEALQRRALQKLWRLDPAFGHIDGLLEYGEDFTDSGLVEAVNTIYRVGKGMRTDEEEAAERAAVADAETAAPAEAEAQAEDDSPADSEAETQADPQAISHADADTPTADSAVETSPDRAALQRDPPRDQ